MQTPVLDSCPKSGIDTRVAVEEAGEVEWLRRSVRSRAVRKRGIGGASWVWGLRG